MKKLLLAVIFAAIAIVQSGFAQVPTQEQLQASDEQLNQVYQKLRGSLNDAQKQQLKHAQREWIKQRDAFVAANPGNPQGALYQATMQRVATLQGVLQKVSGQSSGEGVPTQAHEETVPPTVQQYGIYQQQGETRFTQVSDHELEKADADLNNVYQQIMQFLDSDEREKLKVGQRGWITQRDAIIAQQQNQRYALKYITEQRTRELKERLPDPYKAAKKELRDIYNKYTRLLDESALQKFNAKDGLNISKELEYSGNADEARFNRVKDYLESLKRQLGQNSEKTSALEEIAVAFQNKHLIGKDDKIIPLNAVYLKKPDVYITSLGREIKIWEGKTGKLLRDVPVSSDVDSLASGYKSNSINWLFS